MTSPDNSFAAFLLSLQKEGKLEIAIGFWKHLLSVLPPVPGITSYLDSVGQSLNEIAYSLDGQSKFDEALTFFQLALQASIGGRAAILHNEALCLRKLGRLSESMSFLEQSLRLDPHSKQAQDTYLMGIHYLPNITTEIMGQACTRWAQEFEARLPALTFSHRNTRDPERPLRLGLVSGDFWSHPVSIFLVRFLENLDRTRYITTAYSNNAYKDPMSMRLRKAVHDWQDIYALDDAALANKIHLDGIDILIDLAGHTGLNRLGVFRHKPAPIQISWLGYPGCSGLSTIDYIIGDPYVMPFSMQPHMRGRILHLPEVFGCFDPLPYAPEITPPPACKTGQITFGCFNNPVKCNDRVIQVWARLMKEVPHSRLILKHKGFDALSAQHYFSALFAAQGIDRSRLDFRGSSILSQMHTEIAETDLALDPFPFAGGATTCVTLWMGVPVITLPGDTFASRQGLSFFSALGITETIVRNEDEYVAKAIELTRDLDHLAALRQRLRPAMEKSALCDGVRAARGLDELLRGVWKDWCSQPSKPYQL